MTDEEEAKPKGIRPPPRRRGVLDAVEQRPEIAKPQPPDHMTIPSDDEKLVDLNFKVPAWFHKRFKVECAVRGMNGKQLLFAFMTTYLEVNGGTLSEPIGPNIEPTPPRPDRRKR